MSNVKACQPFLSLTLILLDWFLGSLGANNKKTNKSLEFHCMRLKIAKLGPLLIGINSIIRLNPWSSVIVEVILLLLLLIIVLSYLMPLKELKGIDSLILSTNHQSYNAPLHQILNIFYQGVRMDLFMPGRLTEMK